MRTQIGAMTLLLVVLSAAVDPTGDRAPRTRRLLELWRESVGRPPLEETPTR